MLNDEKNSTWSKCPHASPESNWSTSKYEPLSYMPPQNPDPNSSLPEHRQISQIPKTPSASGSSEGATSTACPHLKNKEQSEKTNNSIEENRQIEESKEYWVYPSQKQFYEAMKRKNFQPKEEDMPALVSIHNVINERAWKMILDYEQKYSKSCSQVTLKRFVGKPNEPSPKARFYSLFGYQQPFDRHDWYIDRCGEEVRYVIDFYQGAEKRSLLSVFIDARPALDSVQSLYDRVLHWLK